MSLCWLSSSSSSKFNVVLLFLEGKEEMMDAQLRVISLEEMLKVLSNKLLFHRHIEQIRGAKGQEVR